MSNLRMCPHCRAFIPSSERVCTECNNPMPKPYGKRVADGAVALAGLVPPTHLTTLIILLINAGLFAATLLLSMQRSGDAWSVDGEILYLFGAKESFSILAGHQWWRLFTAGFLHGGVVHILMNSWVLYDLGAQVEQAYGTARFLVFYILSSAFGFLASTIFSRSYSIGASAALFGLIGAMIVYSRRNRTALGSAMGAVYMRWAIYGLLFGLLPMFRIDNAAHIGGLIGGLGLAYIAGTPGPRAADWLWKAAAAFSVLLALVSFLFVWLAYPSAPAS